ncbi:MAG: integrase [Comamonadaceae bacterium]|nr:MAG: integrase [Comamonadaceae bacterium]
MPNIRVHKPNGALFFDFRYNDERCREYTLLPDTPVNRKKLQKVLDKIESEIADGSFVYASYFPNSKALKRLAKASNTGGGLTVTAQAVDATVQAAAAPVVQVGPKFGDFATQWFDERSIEWRRSHIKSLLSTLNGHLMPHFGGKVVGSITKSEVLEFRAQLAKVKGRGTKEGLSPKRINEIMGLLRQILNEAADRFEFTSPMLNIKKLRQRKTDVEPFSFGDVQRILATTRVDYKNYFTTRFLTGMRTGEVHGLKWKYVDFDLRIIRVRETFVLGEDEYTKTDGSQRDIQMSQPVFEALKSQWEATGKVSEYVFCNMVGEPVDNKNFSDRVWYPLLRHLGLKARRPYQMRHTAATLWLASGEAPEWIARQLGHTSTEMLFRVYSRYVPNLTRQDGSAMERLLASQMSQGALIQQKQPGSDLAIFVPAQEVAPMAQPKARGVHGRASPPGVYQTVQPHPSPGQLT